MKIQSLSIVIPTKRCLNNCPFCVSKMHDNDYSNAPFDFFQMEKRLKYAINNGVNTLILTGTGEALQNIKFLKNLSGMIERMSHPFPNIELQTTGILLNKSKKSADIWDGLDINEYTSLSFLKNLGVNTISLSVSSIWDDDRNMNIIGVPERLKFKLRCLISILKSKGFNVRLSLNMTKEYDKYTPGEILLKCKYLEADQITFRKLYKSEDDTPESDWVSSNSCNSNLFKKINKHISKEGKKLYKLPYGPIAFSIHGMSTVLDDDCMSTFNNDSLKYLILREDGKLYCRWDDKGSLIF